jgi:hypothetical protein
MRARLSVMAVVLLATLAATPLAAAAQGWALDAYAGRAVYDPVSTDVGTSNAVLGVRYGREDATWFYLSAAVPFAAGDVLWSAAGLSQRLQTGVGSLSAGLDMAAHGHAYRDPSATSFGAGATTQAVPFAAFEAGAGRVEVRSGLMHYASTFSGQTESRTLHDSGVRLILGGALPLELAAEGRYARVDEGNYPYGGAAASVRLGRGEIHASVGRWFSDDLPDASWATGASFAVNPDVAVWGSIRQESSNPLYWNDSRRGWNIGVSRRFGGGAPLPAAVPVPAEVYGGRVTIRVPVSASPTGLYLAGDFTDWTPVAMARAGDFWTLNLPLGRGYYRYAFRTGDGRWFVPDSIPGRRDDGFGGHVAVLVVP